MIVNVDLHINRHKIVLSKIISSLLAELRICFFISFLLILFKFLERLVLSFVVSLLLLLLWTLLLNKVREDVLDVVRGDDLFGNLSIGDTTIYLTGFASYQFHLWGLNLYYSNSLLKLISVMAIITVVVYVFDMSASSSSRLISAPP